MLKKILNCDVQKILSSVYVKLRRALISYFSFSITPITNSVANFDKMQTYEFNMSRCKTKQVLEKSNKEEGTS